MHETARVKHVAVVRAVQYALHVIELDANSCARDRLQRCTDVLQQGFDVAPMYVATRRVVKDHAKEVCGAATHRVLTGRGGTQTPPRIVARPIRFGDQPAIAARAFAPS